MADLRGGVLVIDKPAGPTSHDVVAVARRASRGLKVGHVGTLDPLATGVLPLVVGRATRLARLLSDEDKVYEAAIRLGVETDTYDATGAVLGDRRDLVAALTQARVAAGIERFVGAHLQRPPPFSAKKLGGVPAYDRARRGEFVDLDPVPVVLHEAEILEQSGGLVRVRLRCSPGYYVRALAHDLGAELGTGGCLESLRRVRSGRFDVATAITLDVLAADPARALDAIVPLESLLPEIPAVRLTGEGARRVAHGLSVGPAHISGGLPGGSAREARFLSPDGLLLGLGRVQAGGTLRPSVFLGWP
ncbi:MAG: tRNA pseudouridine(55) synthase TruB [Acidobacteriota bacterium]